MKNGIQYAIAFAGAVTNPKESTARPKKRGERLPSNS